MRLSVQHFIDNSSNTRAKPQVSNHQRALPTLEAWQRVVTGSIPLMIYYSFRMLYVWYLSWSQGVFLHQEVKESTFPTGNEIFEGLQLFCLSHHWWLHLNLKSLYPYLNINILRYASNRGDWRFRSKSKENIDVLQTMGVEWFVIQWLSNFVVIYCKIFIRRRLSFKSNTCKIIKLNVRK